LHNLDIRYDAMANEAPGSRGWQPRSTKDSNDPASQTAESPAAAMGVERYVSFRSTRTSLDVTLGIHSHSMRKTAEPLTGAAISQYTAPHLMQTSDLDQQIRDRIETFVQELSSLVRQSAVQAVTSVLGGGSVRRGPGRPRSNTLGRAFGTLRRGPGRPSGGRRKGEKRDPGQLAQLTDKLYASIKSKSGQRIEEIASAMGISTKELTLPAKKLIAQKKVSTKGQKRATRYFAR